MVGMHGHNKSGQCLTYEELYAHEELQGSSVLAVDLNQENKHYIMCCEQPK